MEESPLCRFAQPMGWLRASIAIVPSNGCPRNRIWPLTISHPNTAGFMHPCLQSIQNNGGDSPSLFCILILIIGHVHRCHRQQWTPGGRSPRLARSHPTTGGALLLAFWLPTRREGPIDVRIWSKTTGKTLLHCSDLSVKFLGSCVERARISLFPRVQRRGTSEKR